MTETEFQKVTRRFGAAPVQEAIQARERFLRKKESFWLEHLGSQARQAYRVLFDTDLTSENLWQRFLSVSNPATDSHQTPEARVTPGGPNGKT